MTLIELLLVLFSLAGLWAGVVVGGRHGFWGGVAGGLCGTAAGFLAYVLFMFCLIGLIKIGNMLSANRRHDSDDASDAPGAVWPPPPKVPDDKGRV